MQFYSYNITRWVSNTLNDMLCRYSIPKQNLYYASKQQLCIAQCTSSRLYLVCTLNSSVGCYKSQIYISTKVIKYEHSGKNLPRTGYIDLIYLIEGKYLRIQQNVSYNIRLHHHPNILDSQITLQLMVVLVQHASYSVADIAIFVIIK